MAGVNLTKWSQHAGGQFVIGEDDDDDNDGNDDEYIGDNDYCKQCDCR